MVELVQTMALPFLACLVLTGIHVYLGIHVIERKVIFVDLALATIAALGAVWGALLGWDLHEDGWAIKGFSLAFTFVGAAVFSLTRMREEKVPHEAIIGITYAVALGAMILGSAKLPHGAEEVRDLQAGSILWVDGATIALTALLYAGIGLFHFVFRHRFFALTRDPEAARAAGVHVRLWDFLFYVSFGFVVTSSVAIAGVLLVFSYLVIPAVVAVLFVRRTGARLAMGWIVGTVVSAVGVVFSYQGDLPSGPVIVVCFGVFLALAGALHHVIASADRKRAVLYLAGGALALFVLVQGSFLLRKRSDFDVAHVLETGGRSERVLALARVAEEPGLWPDVAPLADELLASGELEVRLGLLKLISEFEHGELLSAVQDLLFDPDDVVREQALRCIRELGVEHSIDRLVIAAAEEEDDYLRVALAHTLVEAGDERGVPHLLDLMAKAEAVQARRDAYEHLRAHLNPPLPYDAGAAAVEREREVAAIESWWRDHGARASIPHQGG